MTHQPHPGALALVAAAEQRLTFYKTGNMGKTDALAAQPVAAEGSPPPRRWSRLSDLSARAQPGCTICGGKTGWLARIVDCGGQRGLEIVACQCTGLA